MLHIFRICTGWYLRKYFLVERQQPRATFGINLSISSNFSSLNIISNLKRTVFKENVSMQLVLLHLFVGVHLVCAGTHSLRYFYTGVSGINDFPEFTIVGLVDEGQFYYFDSKIMKAVPKTEWIRQNEGADYWEGGTQSDIGEHQIFKNNIQILKERFNQTSGVHTWQLMYGCELDDDDGTKRGYFQIGYDGEDFLSLDKSYLTWTAANPQAMITKVKWDSTRAYAMEQKEYLENECIEWIKKYVGYGKDTLERKVSPQVSVLKKSSSSPVKCHATGFYPKEVTISWMKNGQDHDEDVEVGQVLPNEDGTFQKTSTIRVTPEERKNNEFTCVVEHQGETIREILKDDSPIGIIVGVVVAVVLLLAVIGVVVFKVLQKKKKPDFTPVNGSDDGSNRS